MELHAKTSIRDTSFYFRVKRDNKEGSTDLHPAFIYGWEQLSHASIYEISTKPTRTNSWEGLLSCMVFC